MSKEELIKYTHWLWKQRFAELVSTIGIDKIVEKYLIKQPSEADIPEIRITEKSSDHLPDVRKVIEPIKTAEETQNKITDAFCDFKEEDIDGKMDWRDRDYFQAGYDFAMEEYRNQGVQLPSEEDVEKQFPIIDTNGMNGFQSSLAHNINSVNTQLREGAKWAIKKLQR